MKKKIKGYNMITIEDMSVGLKKINVKRGTACQ